jgi:hypothetical protein
MDQLAEIDLVRRALALRARRRIGVLYSHEHSYYIASDELDPFATRTRVSLDRLRAIVEEAESLERRPNSVEIGNNPLADKTNSA